VTKEEVPEIFSFYPPAAVSVNIFLCYSSITQTTLLYDKYSTTGRQAFDEFEKFWNPNKDCGDECCVWIAIIFFGR
ncbi:MAG: hypothetical protein J6F33_05745, partial [Acidaminococcaceae bacterium]|nr:hypothetical protein [Acidaminococcaceae bacterium]